MTSIRSTMQDPSSQVVPLPGGVTSEVPPAKVLLARGLRGLLPPGLRGHASSRLINFSGEHTAVQKESRQARQGRGPVASHSHQLSLLCRGAVDGRAARGSWCPRIIEGSMCCFSAALHVSTARAFSTVTAVNHFTSISLSRVLMSHPPSPAA